MFSSLIVDKFFHYTSTTCISSAFIYHLLVGNEMAFIHHLLLQQDIFDYPEMH